MILDELKALDPGAEIAAGASGVVITGLTADSRLVNRGDLFAAFAGSKTDGAGFIADAVDRGAVAVIAAPDATIPEGVPVVRSRDPRRLFALAAARFHGAQPQTMVAVTGTAGKTSVASFTRQIWARMPDIRQP
jgi:UDP-N-acetylmuramoyl-L-alanyl-D-glutamate--2,6-diaminopimelate ligase